jgi:hypothetical protein
MSLNLYEFSACVPSAVRRIFFIRIISMCMYSAPSGIVMNDYDSEPLPLTTQKWLRKSMRKKKKKIHESFANYYSRCFLNKCV